MNPLAERIAARIEAAGGSIPVSEYMSLCLADPDHGYYATRDPFGAGGDFTTSPEISQMFGEVIGVWCVAIWDRMGRPEDLVLAELGPGRGTLLADALRAATRVAGEARDWQIWLVETSPALRKVQARTLANVAPNWACSLAEVPSAPVIVLANEFFDALPVRQHQRTDALWRERRVSFSGGGLQWIWGPPGPDPGLDARFGDVSDGTLVESSPAGSAFAGVIGQRLSSSGGAALIIDYGSWDGTGDTLQAVKGHAPVDPLAEPGRADLTAHVDFGALAQAASPAAAHGPVPQGVFLERIGITARAQALARTAAQDRVEDVAAAHRRLTHPDEMGQLFQVLALTHPSMTALPGFSE